MAASSALLSRIRQGRDGRQAPIGPMLGLAVGVTGGLIIGVATADLAVWLALGLVYGPVAAGLNAFVRQERAATESKF